MTNDIINNFFNENYNTLIKICNDYINRYDYKKLSPDEIISELLLFTINNENRKNKLELLISLSATTSQYTFNTQAMYYIINIIYKLTCSHRTFNNNCNINKLIISYQNDLSYKMADEIQEIYDVDYLKLQEIYTIAKNVSDVDNNWWKYKVWSDYYISKMNYKQLSAKYNLTISPLFRIVKSFNTLLQVEINKVSTLKKKTLLNNK